MLRWPTLFVFGKKREGGGRRKRRKEALAANAAASHLAHPGPVPLDHHTRRCAPTFTPLLRGGGGSSPRVALARYVNALKSAAPRSAGGPPSIPQVPSSAGLTGLYPRLHAPLSPR